ncbi:50S ribosomal protein L4 [Aquisalinus flavus]|uniref:Large ribosomal subunit protein uL4 n=1 Tax=Aquisalinus flavus TaxID=1526572 RepID=A0A8J2Y3J1_9PROT|nr:50S ribosomal protein L4 [Aquisalinus flavus]MBD0427998.1 50S ribosomal protein L4 [Aquisalinus flavus]UNE47750.1 50S ribosomal protein L4 [Aquisalinus flavus]GGD05588.1 50S ribosomal protein L4 [Aquisalinus flavus]
MKIDVVTLANEKAGSVDLDEAIFGLEPRKDILHRCVIWQLAKRQQGTHKTKERGEVAGTSKKFVRQKGSGGARHGNRKAPLFVGGGVAHGPRVRSHAIDLPKKVRKLALRHALSAKHGASELIIIDDAKLEEAKTKALVSTFAKLGLTDALIVDTEIDENFRRAARNVPGVDVLPVMGANVYDILRRSKLVLTKSAVEGLEARLKSEAPKKGDEQ